MQKFTEFSPRPTDPGTISVSGSHELKFCILALVLSQAVKKKKYHMHQNTFPFAHPSHNVWNAAFSRTGRKNFPDLFHHMNSSEMFLLADEENSFTLGK